MSLLASGGAAGIAREGAGIGWKPQPGPQTAFVTSDVFELVYGGARGGGKTDAALGDFARHQRLYRSAARGLLVRRTRVALEPTLQRATAIFAPEGAVFIASRSCFSFASGAVLYCRYLDRDADAETYQGHSYTRVYVEEMTQFPSPSPIAKLKATLRSAEGVPCGLRATCNPGGAGHAWVKERHIDPGPWRLVFESFASPFDGTKRRLSRVFIPARLSDNPALLARDPDYVARIQLCGSAELVRAWLEGDWAITEGAFFDRWRPANVVEPFVVPTFWTRFRAFDWGYASPFSVGWWAIASDDLRTAGGELIPRGAMVRYREWYGKGAGGAGLRLTAEEVAAGIREREKGDEIAFGVADPSMFREDGGPSIAERMRRCKVFFRPADNTRVGKAGALSGWDQMRARISGVQIAGHPSSAHPPAHPPPLVPAGAGGEEPGSDLLGPRFRGDARDMSRPMLFVFSTCRDFIRTVPSLQHDPDRPEDLDTSAEDHIADETRYACLARPLIAPSSDPAERASAAAARFRREWGGGSDRCDSWKTM